MLLWGMIEEESDGTVSGKESNPSMHRVWDKLKKENGSIPVDTKRILANGVQPESSVQEVREERIRGKT